MAVCTLLNTIQVPSPTVSTAFRMGRKTSGRPRPIKAFCGDMQIRSMTLKNARKLKDLPDTDRHKKHSSELTSRNSNETMSTKNKQTNKQTNKQQPKKKKKRQESRQQHGQGSISQRRVSSQSSQSGQGQSENTGNASHSELHGLRVKAATFIVHIGKRCSPCPRCSCVEGSLF